MLGENFTAPSMMMSADTVSTALHLSGVHPKAPAITHNIFGEWLTIASG